MSVFTKITLEDFVSLNAYNIGDVLSFGPIKEGVTNSNYKIICNNCSYVFTIFEQIVTFDNLSFFIQLMQHLCSKNIVCPQPIITNSDKYYLTINDKPAVLFTCLPGKSVSNLEISTEHVEQIGENLAMIHIAANDFTGEKINDVSLNNWYKLTERFKDNLEELEYGLSKKIIRLLASIDPVWSLDLPYGIIHADLFPDNVLFYNNKISGIVDFYYACNDLFLYDLAICINCWCFDENYQADIKLVRAMVMSYDRIRRINAIEKRYFKQILQAASIRYLMTRLRDLCLNIDETLCLDKYDPKEYLSKLNFHINNDLGKIIFM